MKTIRLSIIAVVLATILVISGTNIADAVPSGAKQFGTKTAEKMRTEEFKQAAKQNQVQKTEKTNTNTNPDKGFKTTQEKAPSVKKEQVKIEKKTTEQQKAIEKLKITFRYPF